MSLNLERYFERIAFSAPRTASLETLRALHLAHVSSIPFEDLDVLLGRPISLDLGDIQAKLVEQRRGGYCFEQNALFAAALEALGFRVARYQARVRLGSTKVRPQSHSLLGVILDGVTWIADVGFGGDAFVLPMRLDERGVVTQGGWSFRIALEGERTYVVQTLKESGWYDLYAFTTTEVPAIDYEVANHYMSTSSRSPFVRALVVQRSGKDGRWVLHNRRLTFERAHDGAPGVTREVTELADDDAVFAALSSVFGLEVTKTPLPIGPGEPFAAL
jgi:N-hydroxyarylamine O-acetyltransferase